MSKPAPKQKQSKNRKGRFQVIPRTWYRTDPPPFNPQPWNKITLEFNFTGLTPSNYGIITLTNVVNTIRDQTGADVISGAWWLFRFHGLAAWEMEGNPLEVVINDLDRLSAQTASDNDFQALRTLSDLPARNQWAHVTFVWPRDNRNNTFTNKDAGLLNIATIKANNDEGTSKVRVYLKVLWRSSNVNTPGRAITLSGPDSPRTKGSRVTPPQTMIRSGSSSKVSFPLDSGFVSRSENVEKCLDKNSGMIRQRPSSRAAAGHKTIKYNKLHKSCEVLPNNSDEAERLYHDWAEESCTDSE